MPVRVQHVVTKNLLAQFSNSDGFVNRIFKVTGHSGLRPISREGYVPDFITSRSEDAEARWNEIEDKMDDVYSHLENRTLFDYPSEVELCKRFMALHLIRSKRIHLTLPALLQQINDQSIARTAATPNISPDQRILVNTIVNAELRRQILGGEWLRQILFYWLEFIGNDFQSRNLEIGIATEGSFVIGDNPMVLFDNDRRVVDAGINDADVCFMPFGPKHVVSLKSTSRDHNSYRQINLNGVNNINDLSISSAFTRYYSMPIVE